MAKSKSQAQSSHHPHDTFFKQSFSDLQIVIDYILNCLPQKISSKLDLSTLKKISTSYVNDELKTFASDIVYSCQLKGGMEVKISLLFEHKSYLPDFPIFFATAPLFA